MKEVSGSAFQYNIFKLAKIFFNEPVAVDLYRKIVFRKDNQADTYVFNKKMIVFTD